MEDNQSQATVKRVKSCTGAQESQKPTQTSGSDHQLTSTNPQKVCGCSPNLQLDTMKFQKCTKVNMTQQGRVILLMCFCYSNSKDKCKLELMPEVRHQKRTRAAAYLRTHGGRMMKKQQEITES